MSRIVLDASVVLAIIHQERGSQQLTPELLTTSAMSTVNLTEAHRKLVISGWNADEAWLDATSPVGEIVPFTASQAKTAGGSLPERERLDSLLGIELVLPLRSN